MARRKKAAAENGAGTALADPPARGARRARQAAAFVLGELGHAVLEVIAPGIGPDDWHEWTRPSGTAIPDPIAQQVLAELEERAEVVRAFRHEAGTEPDLLAPLETLRAGLEELRASKGSAPAPDAPKASGDPIADRIARKAFSFVTVRWREVRPAGDDHPCGWAGLSRSFVVWEHRKKKAEGRARAFWARIHGEEAAILCEFDIYPRNYVREAEALARSGWHDEAGPPEVVTFKLVTGDMIPPSEWREQDAAAAALGDGESAESGAHPESEAARDLEPHEAARESAVHMRDAERAAVRAERARIVAALEELLEKANEELGDLDTKPAAMKVAQVTAHVARQAIAIVRGAPGDAGPLFEGLDS